MEFTLCNIARRSSSYRANYVSFRAVLFAREICHSICVPRATASPRPSFDDDDDDDDVKISSRLIRSATTDLNGLSSRRGFSESIHSGRTSRTRIYLADTISRCRISQSSRYRGDNDDTNIIGGDYRCANSANLCGARLDFALENKTKTRKREKVEISSCFAAARIFFRCRLARRSERMLLMINCIEEISLGCSFDFPCIRADKHR